MLTLPECKKCMPPDKRAPDLLRRFTPTPLLADLSVMGRLIHVETNSPSVFEQITHHLRLYANSRSERPDFGWRIVSEGGSAADPEWPELTAFSHDGLSYAGIGHHGFLAVDSRQREAVAFLPEGLVSDRSGFARPFLAMLFSLTLRAIGLTGIAAACVARGKVGLLIFGSSKSGKTVASYLAGQFGLQFHADQPVFLEASADGLRAWGDFWPAVFYEDAEAVLPDVAAIAQQFRYQGRTYFYMHKPSQVTAARSVAPAACVFLERNGNGTPRRTPLQSEEFQKRLQGYSRIGDRVSSQLEQSAVWNLLCSLPAFHISYGSDPGVLAGLFQSLIDGRAS
jgi:hypothetical protein